MNHSFGTKAFVIAALLAVASLTGPNTAIASKAPQITFVAAPKKARAGETSTVAATVPKSLKCALKLESRRGRTFESSSVRIRTGYGQFSWRNPARGNNGLRWKYSVICGRKLSRSGRIRLSHFRESGRVNPILARPRAAHKSTSGFGRGAALPPWGTLLVSGRDWFGGKGVDVFSNGPLICHNDCNDKPRPGRWGIPFQCVELVETFLHARGWISSPIPGDAHRIFANAPGAKFEKHSAGDGYRPVPGDVAVWRGGGGGYGHVAVVDARYGDVVSIVEQNSSSTGRGVVTLSSGSRYGSSYALIGYLHARANPSTGNLQGSGGVGTRLIADANGDGRGDAIVMFRDSGVSMVALAKPEGGFSGPSEWSYGQSAGATRYFAGDVNGDGRADLLAFWADQGLWRASLSSGTGFWPPVDWAYGHGVGTTRQWLADVSGDHRADVVTFDAGSGDWWVSTSSGSGFWSPQHWIVGHGFGSSDQSVADANGDGSADAIVWFGDAGKSFVALSSGSAFGYPGEWSAGHGQGSDQRLFADTTGDSKADEIFFWAADGRWRVGNSSGSGFFMPNDWAVGHGVGTSERFVSDVNVDGMADVITFEPVNGDWWVSLSSGSGFWPPQRWSTGHGAGS